MKEDTKVVSPRVEKGKQLSLLTAGIETVFSESCQFFLIAKEFQVTIGIKFIAPRLRV